MFALLSGDEWENTVQGKRKITKCIKDKQRFNFSSRHLGFLDIFMNVTTKFLSGCNSLGSPFDILRGEKVQLLESENGQHVPQFLTDTIIFTSWIPLRLDPVSMRISLTTAVRHTQYASDNQLSWQICKQASVTLNMSLRGWAAAACVPPLLILIVLIIRTLLTFHPSHIILKHSKVLRLVWWFDLVQLRLGGLFGFGKDILDVAGLEDMRPNFRIPSDWNEFPILFSITFLLRCGPIRANVRWIHYLWPPLFPLFFHRIKPRGRRESLSIFHSSVATKILVFCQFFRRKVGRHIKFYLMLLSPQQWISFVLSKRRSDILPSLWTKNNTKCMNLTIYYNTYRKLLIHIIIWKGHNPHLHSAQI